MKKIRFWPYLALTLKFQHRLEFWGNKICPWNCIFVVQLLPSRNSENFGPNHQPDFEFDNCQKWPFWSIIGFWLRSFDPQNQPIRWSYQKNSTCLINGNIFEAIWKKNQRKSFFAENLHSNSAFGVTIRSTTLDFRYTVPLQ